MARRSTLRASDADRDSVADRLRKATVEGRIAAHELEERLGRVFSARTYGELEDTVADLPGTRRDRARLPARRTVSLVRDHPALLVVAIPLLVAVVALMVAFTVLWTLFSVLVLLLTRRGVPYRRSLACGPWRGRGWA